MENKPVVSVVIPAYNTANTISLAVESALKQDVPSEIIVINDNSDDNISEIMSKYSDCGNVIYISNAEKSGVSASRNKGVSLAKGEYVAFLDADDIWAEGKLEKQLRLVRSTGCVMCATARELINSDGSSVGRVIPVEDLITYKSLLKHNSINCSSVLLKADIAKEFPMEHDDSHEDYITWLRILRKYGNACGINEPLIKYRLTGSGKSGNKLKSAKMTFKAYRYMEFGLIRSVGYFVSYAFNGLKKYFF